MNNYKEFNQSFSNLEPIYMFDEEQNIVVNSGEFRDCQSEIDSYIDSCSSLFLNDLLAEDLSSLSSEFTDEIVSVIPGRQSELEKCLQDFDLYSSVARSMNLDVSNLSFNEIKNLVIRKITGVNNINKEEVLDEKKNESESFETSFQKDGE